MTTESVIRTEGLTKVYRTGKNEVQRCAASTSPSAAARWSR